MKSRLLSKDGAELSVLDQLATAPDQLAPRPLDTSVEAAEAADALTGDYEDAGFCQSCGFVDCDSLFSGRAEHGCR